MRRDISCILNALYDAAWTYDERGNLALIGHADFLRAARYIARKLESVECPHCLAKATIQYDPESRVCLKCGTRWAGGEVIWVPEEDGRGRRN